MACDWTVRHRKCAGEQKNSTSTNWTSFSVLMQKKEKKKVHKRYVICNILDDFISPLC